MGLFGVSIASGITDRVASVYVQVNNAINGLGVVGDATTKGVFPIVSTGNDFFIERDFISPGHEFDNFLSATTVVSSSNQARNLVSALENHCSLNGGTNFDTYLTTNSLKVDEYFAKVYQASRTAGLLAHNVYASI